MNRRPRERGRKGENNKVDRWAVRAGVIDRRSAHPAPLPPPPVFLTGLCFVSVCAFPSISVPSPSPSPTLPRPQLL